MFKGYRQIFNDMPREKTPQIKKPKTYDALVDKG